MDLHRALGQVAIPAFGIKRLKAFEKTSVFQINELNMKVSRMKRSQFLCAANFQKNKLISLRMHPHNHGNNTNGNDNQSILRHIRPVASGYYCRVESVVRCIDRFDDQSAYSTRHHKRAGDETPKPNTDGRTRRANHILSHPDRALSSGILHMNQSQWESRGELAGELAVEPCLSCRVSMRPESGSALLVFSGPNKAFDVASVLFSPATSTFNET